MAGDLLVTACTPPGMRVAVHVADGSSVELAIAYAEGRAMRSDMVVLRDGKLLVWEALPAAEAGWVMEHHDDVSVLASVRVLANAGVVMERDVTDLRPWRDRSSP